jgi:hypothetical protein
MRRVLGLVLAAAGLTVGLAADGDKGEKKVFLVYSADERSELAPCG